MKKMSTQESRGVNGGWSLGGLLFGVPNLGGGSIASVLRQIAVPVSPSNLRSIAQR